MANGQLKGEDLVNSGVFQTFERLDKIILEEIQRMNQLEAATRAALGGSALNANAQQFQTSAKKTTSALTEQEKVMREIARLQERNNQVTRDSLAQLQAERTKRNQLNQTLRDEAVLTSTLSDAYTKLRKARDLAGKNLRNLIVDNKASNRELRTAQREFDKLDKKVRQADRAVGNFRDNVGNYGTATRRIVGFTRELIAAFGLYSAIQIGQSIYETTKQLDALRYGLEQVTETTEDFTRAQDFLDRLSERAGADLLVLTSRYTNFLAAAKTTNLTLKETEGVFEAVVVSGTLLGRSTDDINGALRALEQILSKGKVQAEELRGQLGERLPGAFQILEKALGLANGELNELLEVGGLLSVEALPALKRGLEDTFNLDTINKVENLATAQVRLTNEWNIFLRDLEKGTGVISTVSKFFFDFLSTSIRGFAILTRSVEENNKFFEQIARQDSFKETLASITAEAERTGQSLEDVARGLQSDFIQQLNLAQSEVQRLQNEISKTDDIFAKGALNVALQDQIRKVSVYQGGLDAVKQVLADFVASQKDAADSVEDVAATIERLREKLEALRKERDTTDYETDIARIRELNVQIKETEDLIAKLTGAYKGNKKVQDQMAESGTLEFFEDLAGVLEALIDNTIVGTAEWLEYTKALKEVNEQIKAIEDEAAILQGDLSSLNDFFDLGDLNLFDEIDNFLSNEGLDVILADFANRFKFNRQEIVDEYIALYGRDFEKFKEFEENKLKTLQLVEAQKLEIRQRTLDLADALSQAFLEIQLNRLDEEEERQNEIFDSVVSNKESSEEAIAQAERDREENEKRIEKERKQRENQAFLFRQALAIGDIFIADALARANAIASTAAIIPYIPLGAATLATLQKLITVNTGLALATVLAQSLPAFFFKGKALGNKYQGPGIWGEFQREVKVGADGRMEVSPDGPSPTYVKSSDIILESFGAFRKQMSNSNSEVYKRVMRGVESKNERRLQIITADPGFNSKGLEDSVSRAVARGLSKARLSPHIHIHTDNKVRRVP